MSDAAANGGDAHGLPLGVSALATAQLLPQRIASDGEYVYWLNVGHVETTNTKSPQDNIGGSVNACSVDGCGGAPKVLASSVSTFPYRVSLAAAGGRAFWTQEGYPTADGSIQSASIASGSTNTLFATTPTEIVAYGDSVYWVDGGPVVHGCSIDDCTSPQSFGNANDATAVLQGGLLADDTTVYWVNGYLIQSCPRSGCIGAPAVVMSLDVPSTGIRSPLAVGDDLYFIAGVVSGADAPQGEILRCAKAGCAAPTVFVAGLVNLASLASDGKSIYVDEHPDQCCAVGSPCCSPGHNVARVDVCPLSGCAQHASVFADGQQIISNLTADSRHVFWATSGAAGGPGTVHVASLGR